ncbi:MAG: HEAT repeat domain-containing protein [Acidobacteriota bacterium]
MNTCRKQNLLFLGCLSVCLWLSAACAKAQTIPIKALPIYEQCPALTAGADEGVTKSIAALKSQDAKVRAQAARQLSQSCDSRAIDPLIDALADSDTDVRIATVEALGKLGDPNSVEFMINVIGSSDWRTRLALISSFASFKTFLARNAVVNHIANPSGADITDETDMRVRCVAILTACQLKDVSHSRKSILFLNGFLQSKHENIRKLAEQTLLELKNTRNGATEMGAILKQSNDPNLRRWAATWIGKIGMEGARDALQQAATNDADPSVRQIATESLKQLPVPR